MSRSTAGVKAPPAPRAPPHIATAVLLQRSLHQPSFCACCNGCLKIPGPHSTAALGFRQAMRKYTCQSGHKPIQSFAELHTSIDTIFCQAAYINRHNLANLHINLHVGRRPVTGLQWSHARTHAHTHTFYMGPDQWFMCVACWRYRELKIKLSHARV